MQYIKQKCFYIDNNNEKFLINTTVDFEALQGKQLKVFLGNWDTDY